MNLKRYKELERRSTLKPGTVELKRTRLNPVGKWKKSKRKRREEVVDMAMRRDSYRCQAAVRIQEGLRGQWPVHIESSKMGERTFTGPELAALLRRAEVPVTCHGPLDPHEIIQRSAWRDGDLDLDNVIIACRRHHDWIDHDQLTAELLGLHKWSWNR